jgi:uncharacterized protein YegL
MKRNNSRATGSGTVTCSPVLLKLASVTLLMLMAISAMGSSAWCRQAGIRTSDTDGRVDLVVLFLYDVEDYDGGVPGSELARWEATLTRGSELLFAATDGAVQIGEVRWLKRDKGADARNKADIWISHDDTKLASANSEGYEDGDSTSMGRHRFGRHVYLSRRHLRNDTVPGSDGDTVKGQFAIVHELGHYLFGLGDEYGGHLVNESSDKVINPWDDEFAGAYDGQYMWRNENFVRVDGVPGAKAFYCTHETFSNGPGTPHYACIMDGGSGVDDRRHRQEFCLPQTGDAPYRHVGERIVEPFSLHFMDGTPYEVTTAQHGYNIDSGDPRSCWWMMWSKLVSWGLASGDVPGSVAIETLPNPPGHDPLEFKEFDFGARFSLCLDSSGSMTGTRIDLTKDGAKRFVQNARKRRLMDGEWVSGDEIGVVQFSSSAAEVHPMIEIENDGDKDAINAAIESEISAGGATAMGHGLLLAYNQLDGQPGDPGYIDVIVLLSDGKANSGIPRDPMEVVNDQLKPRGTNVFTIGVGNDAIGTSVNQVLLGEIAEATGGKYYYVYDDLALPTLFLEVQDDAIGAGQLRKESGTLNPGDPSHAVEGILIDEFPEEVRFVTVGYNLDVDIVWRYENEDGSWDAKAWVGTTETTEGKIHTTKVKAAEQDVLSLKGQWLVLITKTASPAPDPPNWHFLATSLLQSSRGPALFADGPLTVDFSKNAGAELKIEATLTEGASLMGANVRAMVKKPDGETTFLPLLDNADPANGDDHAGDGIYSGIFTDFGWYDLPSGGSSGDGSYSFTIRADTDGAVIVPGEDGPIPPPQYATPAERSTSWTTYVQGVAPPNIDCFGVNEFRFSPQLQALLMKGEIHSIAPFHPDTESFTIRVTDLSDLDIVDFQIPVGGLTPAPWAGGGWYQYGAPFGDEPNFRFYINVMDGRWVFDMSSWWAAIELDGPDFDVAIIGSSSGEGSETFTTTYVRGWHQYLPVDQHDCGN